MLLKYYEREEILTGSDYCEATVKQSIAITTFSHPILCWLYDLSRPPSFDMNIQMVLILHFQHVIEDSLEYGVGW